MLKRLLYYLYFFAIALPLFILSTILCSLIAILGCFLGGARIFGYYPGVIWSRIALVLFLCPVQIEGKEYISKARQGSYLIMANHQSSLDIFLIYGYLGIPFRYMLKEALRKVPFIGQFCQVAGFIYVDERRTSSVKESMIKGRETLRKGISIVLFPEGHRSRNGQLLPLKRGGFRLAYQIDAPILPLVLKGTYTALLYGKYIPSPRKLSMTIFPPFVMDKENREEAETLSTAMNKVKDIFTQNRSI